MSNQTSSFLQEVLVKPVQHVVTALDGLLRLPAAMQEAVANTIIHLHGSDEVAHIE